jgi:hypothetical protein
MANEMMLMMTLGATATIDVTIAVNNNAATATIEDDEGNHPWQ